MGLPVWAVVHSSAQTTAKVGDYVRLKLNVIKPAFVWRGVFSTSRRRHEIGVVIGGVDDLLVDFPTDSTWWFKEDCSEIEVMKVVGEYF
jgi:hypothetical protein